MHVRRLVGTKGVLMDPQVMTPQIAFYNPSAADDWICIRVSEFTSTEDRSDMLLCNTKTKETKRISSPYDMLQPTMNIYKGLEDVRIVRFQGRLWFTASCTHASSAMLNELVVGYFTPALDAVEYCQKVDLGADTRPPIKNIVPYVWKDRLWVMDVLQQKMYALEENAEKRILVTNAREIAFPVVHNYGRLRGSTNPVHLHGNLWGCVVHSILFNDTPIKEIQLAYMHHWMEFDMERGCVTYLSTPFWCMNWGVEFVSGCTIERREGREECVHLYLGLRDKQPAKVETTLVHLRVSKDG